LTEILASEDRVGEEREDQELQDEVEVELDTFSSDDDDADDF